MSANNSDLNVAAAKLFKQDDTYKIYSGALTWHLSDNEWLANKLRELCLEDVSLEGALYYVSVSPSFALLKHNFAKKVVKFQIEAMLNGGEAALAFNSSVRENMLLDKDRDVIFRRSIVSSLLTLGLSFDSIEDGIEANADLWKEKEMEATFKNIFQPNDEVEPCSTAHYQSWMKLRKYDYYLSHLTSVEKYGKVDDDMQMSREEVTSLREFVAQENARRLNYLESLGFSQETSFPRE